MGLVFGSIEYQRMFSPSPCDFVDEAVDEEDEVPLPLGSVALFFVEGGMGSGTIGDGAGMAESADTAPEAMLYCSVCDCPFSTLFQVRRKCGSVFAPFPELT